MACRIYWPTRCALMIFCRVCPAHKHPDSTARKKKLRALLPFAPTHNVLHAHKPGAGRA